MKNLIATTFLFIASTSYANKICTAIPGTGYATFGNDTIEYPDNVVETINFDSTSMKSLIVMDGVELDLPFEVENTNIYRMTIKDFREEGLGIDVTIHYTLDMIDTKNTTIKLDYMSQEFEGIKIATLGQNMTCVDLRK